MSFESQGLKPSSYVVLNVRAKARTYLRSKSKSKNRSRFPEGMTERKTTARAKAEADPAG
jgi:hypothetical protein